MDWLAFLHWEESQQVTKQDIYLAQIAREMRRSYVKSPNTVKIEPFLLNEKQASTVRGVAASKQVWMEVLKVKPKRKP